MFRALHIIKPIWYFNKVTDQTVWVDPEGVENKYLDKITAGNNYSSEYAKKADISYQLLQIRPPSANDKKLDLKTIAIKDEYIFLARYFSRFWRLYYLILRVLSFKNPVTEIAGFIRSRKVKRFNWQDLVDLPQPKLDDLAALGPKEKWPLVSVIIPTLNRYEYLSNALEDLYIQTYPNIEILVIDQSDNVSKDFLERHEKNIRYVRQEEKALWLARNSAVELAKGEYLLLYDDDSRVEEDWVEMHMKCLLTFDAQVSSGVSYSTSGDSIPVNYRYFRLSDQLDTGNVLIKRDVFNKVGLFDRQFEKQRMGDGEFGMRVYLAGFKNISNPKASRLHLKVPSGGLRQHGHWDGWRPKKIFAPRPIPSVLYLSRKYFGSKGSIRYLGVNLLPSILPYRWKSKRRNLIFAIPLLPFLMMLIFIQASISWRKSTRMLRQGPKVNFPNV